MYAMILRKKMYITDVHAMLQTTFPEDNVAV